MIAGFALGILLGFLIGLGTAYYIWRISEELRR
jgi:uncharacterized membrane protein YccC